MLSHVAKEKIENQKKNRSENFHYVMNQSIEQQRKDWEASASLYELPDFLRIEDHLLAGVSAELIQFKGQTEQVHDQLILHFHGGGLTLGSAITHRKLGGLIAEHTHVPVMIHNYPLAPEYPYPVALESSLDFYQTLLKSENFPAKIIFSGDSSGCGLACGVILKILEDNLPLPSGLILMSPQLDNTFSGQSFEENKGKDYTVFKEDLALTALRYCGDAPPDDPFISPIFANLTGFPPTFVQSGSHELLLSDGADFAEKLETAGVPVTLDIWEGMWHVFQSSGDKVPEAIQALERIRDFAAGL